MASLFIISLLSPVGSITSGTVAAVSDFVAPADETNLFIARRLKRKGADVSDFQP